MYGLVFTCFHCVPRTGFERVVINVQLSRTDGIVCPRSLSVGGVHIDEIPAQRAFAVLSTTSGNRASAGNVAPRPETAYPLPRPTSTVFAVRQRRRATRRRPPPARDTHTPSAPKEENLFSVLPPKRGRYGRTRSTRSRRTDRRKNSSYPRVRVNRNSCYKICVLFGQIRFIDQCVFVSETYK